MRWLLGTAFALLAALLLASPAAAYRSCGDINLGASDQFANCQWWLADQYLDDGLTHYGIAAAQAWPQTQGAGVTVAVVDTGVDPNHPDYRDRLLTSAGRNFYDGGAWSDADGHGTLVTGIVAAGRDNGGYVGTAPQAQILPVKVMGAGEFSDKAAVAGIRYALSERARVLNLSFGGLNNPIAGVQPTLAEASRANALVVVAAGNDGANLDSPIYEWSPDGRGQATTITVASTNYYNLLASNSNYGAYAVQIAAPGAYIQSDYLDFWYGGGSGTSFAAPMVSGVAALLFSAYPEAKATDVRRAIIVGGRKLPTLAGKVTCGCLLNAPGALAAMATPDRTAPSAFKQSQSIRLKLQRRKAIILRWSPSSDAELEGYRVVVDGRPRYLPPATRSVRLTLAKGTHRLQVYAYDLSGNATAASR